MCLIWTYNVIYSLLVLYGVGKGGQQNEISNRLMGRESGLLWNWLWINEISNRESGLLWNWLWINEMSNWLMGRKSGQRRNC